MASPCWSLCSYLLAVGDVRGCCELSTATSRFWMCHTICWMVLCQAFLSLLPPPPSPLQNLLSPSPLGRPDTQANYPKRNLSRSVVNPWHFVILEKIPKKLLQSLMNYYKLRYLSLARWTAGYYKLQHLFHYTLRQVSESAMDLLQIVTVITKCDDYSKLRQHNIEDDINSVSSWCKSPLTLNKGSIKYKLCTESSYKY